MISYVKGACIMLAAGVFAGRVLAQATDAVDVRLTGRVDAPTLVSLRVLIDSANGAGLPASPLIDKALEGAAKHAAGDRIVAVVRTLAGQLGAARSILGQTATPEELAAGAAALRSGISDKTLARLRTVRPGQSLTIPLAVAAELVARGVRPDSASATVLRLAAAGAHDSELAAIPRTLGSPYLPGSNGVPSGTSATSNSLVTHIDPSPGPPKPAPKRP